MIALKGNEVLHECLLPQTHFFFNSVPTVCQGCRMSQEKSRAQQMGLPPADSFPALESGLLVPSCVQGRPEDEGHGEPAQPALHPLAVPVGNQPSLPLVRLMPDTQSVRGPEQEHVAWWKGMEAGGGGIGRCWDCPEQAWPCLRLHPPHPFSGRPPSPQASSYGLER